MRNPSKTQIVTSFKNSNSHQNSQTYSNSHTCPKCPTFFGLMKKATGKTKSLSQ